HNFKKIIAMSFANASLPIQLFANEYGNIGRTYDVIRYVQETSAMSTAITLDPATFLVQGGKKRAVKLNYFPQVCDVEGDCAANICGESEVLEPRQIMFDITRCIS